MNLVERIKGILLQPKSEWGAIEGEPGSAGYLIPKYVAFVAAIPAVCTFIGTSLIGWISDGHRPRSGTRRGRLCPVAWSACLSWPTSLIFWPARSAREKAPTTR